MKQTLILKDYLGYTGKAEWDAECGFYHGSVFKDGVEYPITFVSDSKKGLKKEFRQSVDEYIKFTDEYYTDLGNQ